MTRVLRKHQEHARTRVLERWGKGDLRTAVVHPTGLGKGDVIGKMAADEVEGGGHPLILAHRGEILDQLAQRIRLYRPGTTVGRVQGPRNEVRRQVTTAMVQTAWRPNRQKRMTKPSLIIVDECHRAASDSYLRCLEWGGSFEDTRTAGFTATLVRGDKRELGDVWQSVADKIEIKWAVDNEFLVRPYGRVVVADHIDLNAAKISKGDYQDGDLGEMVVQDVDQIVRAWVEHAAKPDGSARRTVAFVPTVASAHALRDAFAAHGITSEAVTGDTPDRERAGIYARLHSGQTRVLVNVFVLVEGWDEPKVECILWCRPTRLPGVYVQGVGRGLRPDPDPATTKTDCLVLDVVGASRTQALVTLVDLGTSPDYDTSALDALPCPGCHNPRSECTCPAEAAERDPDGGRRRLIGPAVYEDLDLLMQKSPYTWLQTYGGAPFISAGDRTAFLWLNPKTDLYWAGHRKSKGRNPEGEWLAKDVSLDEGRTHAEAWALEYAPSLASRKASWRGGRPSPAQLALAENLGIIGAERMNKARLSDELSIVFASRVLDRRAA